MMPALNHSRGIGQFTKMNQKATLKVPSARRQHNSGVGRTLAFKVESLSESGEYALMRTPRRTKEKIIVELFGPEK